MVAEKNPHHMIFYRDQLARLSTFRLCMNYIVGKLIGGQVQIYKSPLIARVVNHPSHVVNFHIFVVGTLDHSNPLHFGT